MEKIMIEITNCHIKEAIGFIGIKVDKETYFNKTLPFASKDYIERINIYPNQIMVIGKDISFISSKDGFVEYKTLKT